MSSIKFNDLGPPQPEVMETKIDGGGTVSLWETLVLRQRTWRIFGPVRQASRQIVESLAESYGPLLLVARSVNVVNGGCSRSLALCWRIKNQNGFFHVLASPSRVLEILERVMSRIVNILSRVTSHPGRKTDSLCLELHTVARSADSIRLISSIFNQNSAFDIKPSLEELEHSAASRLKALNTDILIVTRQIPRLLRETMLQLVLQALRLT